MKNNNKQEVTGMKAMVLKKENYRIGLKIRNIKHPELGLSTIISKRGDGVWNVWTIRGQEMLLEREARFWEEMVG
jgi:hypothetical protein